MVLRSVVAGSSSGGGGSILNNITGLLPNAISGTNTTAAVTISSGAASDSTTAVQLAGTGYSWAVSNGNAANGYQGGTTLPNSATIHFFLINGVSGTASFASTSLTPTLPTGYAAYYRRIFSLNTNSSGALISGTPLESEGGSLTFYLGTSLLDINTTSLGTTRTLYTLTVPTGFRVQWLYRADNAQVSNNVILTSGDEPDAAPTGGSPQFTTAPGSDFFTSTVAFSAVARDGILTTNTSGQIGARANIASCGLYAVTRGFKDFRRI